MAELTYEDIKDYQLPFISDDFQKFCLNLNTGKEYIKVIIEGVGIKYENIVVQNKEKTRVRKKAKTSLLDEIYLVDDKQIDIEIQRSITMKQLRDKSQEYLASILVSADNKGKEYGTFRDAILIMIYTSSVSRNNELIKVHAFLPETGTSNIEPKMKAYYIQLGKINQIYRKKGLDRMSRLEIICFYIKNRFNTRYNEQIKRIYDEEEVARYMELKYNEFRMNQTEFLNAVKKDQERRLKEQQERYLKNLRREITRMQNKLIKGRQNLDEDRKKLNNDKLLLKETKNNLEVKDKKMKVKEEQIKVKENKIKVKENQIKEDRKSVV